MSFERRTSFRANVVIGKNTSVVNSRLNIGSGSMRN